jgi:DNA-binding CsgD family transcriptional regulator
MLDRLTLGVVVLDEGARVVEINRSARHIVETAGTLALRDGRLVGASSPVTLRLGRMFAAVLAGRPGGRGEAIESFPAEGGAIEIAVFPVVGDGTGRPPHWMLLFVSEPGYLGEGVEATLADLYELTPSEARLACLLARGLAVGEAAARLGVAVGTARNHLHAVLRKTGTRRQSELVKRIVMGLAGRLSQA